MTVPVSQVTRDYIQTPKNSPILDIFSRTRVRYIQLCHLIILSCFIVPESGPNSLFYDII